MRNLTGLSCQAGPDTSNCFQWQTVAKTESVLALIASRMPSIKSTKMQNIKFRYFSGKSQKVHVPSLLLYDPNPQTAHKTIFIFLKIFLNADLRSPPYLRKYVGFPQKSKILSQSICI